MSRDIEHDVDTNSAYFKSGVEARLISAVDSNNRKAGNESGPGPKDEVASEEPESKGISKEPSRPLFLSNSSEGKKGNAQDEKDETPE